MKMSRDIARPGQDGQAGTMDSLAEIMAAMIRERSAAAELISEAEILMALQDGDLVPPNTGPSEEGSTAFLDRLIHENEDLKKIFGKGPPCYYSSLYMTEAYAKILVAKQEGPLPLIAETVRQYSHAYERPISLDVFTQPPFNLEERQILESLAMMAEGGEGFDDISVTSTSAAGVYIYSTFYLEADHAAMLAEWFDVGQSENP